MSTYRLMPIRITHVTEIRPTHWRSLWISDLHLGSAECNAEALLDFLERNESETLYLVGNTTNGSARRTQWHWPQAHNDVVQRILRKARDETRVVLLPGHHDYFLRDLIGVSFGDIDIVDEDVHVTADGRRLLVLSGKSFSSFVPHTRWLPEYGATLRDAIQWFRYHVEHLQNILRLGSGSSIEKLKHNVKNKRSHIEDYALQMTHEARKRGLDGVICGHIHHPQIREIEGLIYCNDGDWVTNLTALAENHQGQLQLIHWTTPHSRRKAVTSPIRHPRPLSLPSLPSSVRAQKSIRNNP